MSGVTTVHIAGIYERQGAAATSYYEGGGLRRSGYTSNNGVFYMLSDHLKSTSALVARNGVLNVKYFYFPYGARRGVPFNSITAKRFTGQYHEASLPGGEGLSFFNARWYDPKLGSFLSADSIVPAPLAPQSLNRYAYVGGNPVNHRDPTGHACDDGPQTYAACYGNKPVSHAVMRAANTPAGPGTVTYSQVKSANRNLTWQLPAARPGFVWRPVNEGRPIQITAYITVLEADRAEYSGPLVSIPGLEGLTPDIPEGMLYDLYEEGSLKLKDGRYVQRNWTESFRQNRPVYMFVDPPPYAAKGRVEPYKTAAANPELLNAEFPADVYILDLGLRVMVNDTGGGLGPQGPLDIYVGEGLASERAFGVYFSQVFVLVGE